MTLGPQSPPTGDRGARIALVGHCGPDAAMLSGAARRALPGCDVLRVSDDAGLASAAEDCDLLLINRSLDGDFAAPDGVAMIASLSGSARARLMLISNYEDAQARAVKAGAAAGFGKAAVNTPLALEAIRGAIGRR